MKIISKTGLAVILLLALSCKKESTLITDKSATQSLVTDNNEPRKYAFVNIGTQNWMTTNLAVNHYRNGDKIPEVRRIANWDTLTTGAWCWYNNDSATGAIYGRLYNWYAVNDPRGLAPTGWHVSNDAEWDTLSIFLGGNTVAGGKLKESGTIHWRYPNVTAKKSSGFEALPGGLRYSNDGLFDEIGEYGYWWTSTQKNGSALATLRIMSYDKRHLSQGLFGSLGGGGSVRCIKD